MPPETKNDDVELTPDEAKALETAFKDENFRALLEAYASEISDPRFREEQEAYVRQLEAQNEVPLGKALVRPSSGFVVKCMHRKKRDGDAVKSKLFLNVVHSEKVEEATVKQADSSGANWSVPYAIGPMRMEEDKSANLVPTFDCCFHPSSLRHAHSRKEFLDLVVNIARDAARVSFANSGEEVEMLPGYTVLRGVSYKSGPPKALMVSTDETEKKESGSKPSPKDSGKSDSEAVVAPREADKAQGKAAHDRDNAMSPLTPNYKIVEQGRFDIADHTTHTNAPVSRRPKQLRVYIHVDKAASAADINLDVCEKELAIKPSSSCRYKLEVKLPFPVNSHKGNASFDKKKKTLVVTLPVVP